ncbi:MAG: hypothetical protein JEZ07_16295 [Phycisphaerae bacterium]|nr:hypothetical protein [Phycisphaerae bacterium]
MQQAHYSIIRLLENKGLFEIVDEKGLEQALQMVSAESLEEFQKTNNFNSKAEPPMK